MTPQQYVQDKAAGSGSSFYYAFLFLPPRKRAAITAFYAFCREVDDVVDEIESTHFDSHWRVVWVLLVGVQMSNPVVSMVESWNDCLDRLVGLLDEVLDEAVMGLSGIPRATTR